MRARACVRVYASEPLLVCVTCGFSGVFLPLVARAQCTHPPRRVTRREAHRRHEGACAPLSLSLTAYTRADALTTHARESKFRRDAKHVRRDVRQTARRLYAIAEIGTFFTRRLFSRLARTAVRLSSLPTCVAQTSRTSRAKCFDRPDEKSRGVAMMTLSR